MIPYKIAVLVYVFNSQERLLLLHRAKAPNQGLYSPIGGKLETGDGESPYACALRETKEEIGVELTLDDIRLVGMVSEKGYMGGGGGAHQAHWLMFCFEVLRPLDFPSRQMEEGTLEWVAISEIEKLSIPKTDREIIWPLVEKHSWVLGEKRSEPQAEMFSVHIDCTDAEKYEITREWPRK